MKAIFVLVSVLLTMVVNAADLLNPVVINKQVPDQYGTWDFTLSESGAPWFAYYGADNLLYVRRPDGSEVGLGATNRKHMQSGLAMMPAKEGLALLWRDKLPRKNLYLISLPTPAGSVPTPVVVGGEESEPLTRLKLAQVDNTDYLLWLGEKGDQASKEKYHLYFRTADQDGKVLSPVEQVMPGRYPAWIIDGGVIPVFSWMAYEGKLAMTMRVFDRAGKKFGPLEKIADAPRSVRSSRRSNRVIAGFCSGWAITGTEGSWCWKASIPTIRARLGSGLRSRICVGWTSVASISSPTKKNTS